MRVIGTINKRVDVGVVPLENNRIYIMSSSNCVTFDDKELHCLMSVLSILGNFHIDIADDWLHKHKIELFEPAPPAAEIKL